MMKILTKPNFKTLIPNFPKSISTFTPLHNYYPLFSDQPPPSQPPPPPRRPSSLTPSPSPNHYPLFSDPPPPPPPSPPPPSTLPPPPSSGIIPWRNPLPFSPSATATTTAILPIGHHSLAPSSLPKDVTLLTNLFADWVTSSRWGDIKEGFDQWIRSLDIYGKPNRPNVTLFNLYLRALLMCGGAETGELIKVVDQMELYHVAPNTASFNLVLKGLQPQDWTTAVSVIERMQVSGKQSQPDNESFDIVIGMLFRNHQIDDALKYVDLTLKSGCMLSPRLFDDCVGSCIRKRKLDTLVSIIEKCKDMDQNKALSPNWNLCNTLAEVAIQKDNNKLTFMAFGFMSRLIQQGENEWPAVRLSVNEKLVIKGLCTAARTYDSSLLDGSWAILKRSLRGKTPPIPETYLAKITALASLGNLPSAFNTLSELENNYRNASSSAKDEMLSPFTSLHPLVVACAKKGQETLDEVYFQLEELSKADPPFISVAALNCVLLGCANIWDLDRAYQTFEAISSSFGLTPNIHSYNALLYAFGRSGKTAEAAKVFEHLRSLDVKPNAKSYNLLVDAHLINRDPKAALATLEAMIEAGFEPFRATLLKAQRRCSREMDRESSNLVQSIAKQRKIILGPETRRNTLFNMTFAAEDSQ